MRDEMVRQISLKFHLIKTTINIKTVTSQQTTKIPLCYLACSFTGLYLRLGNADERYDVKHMIEAEKEQPRAC